MNNIIGIKNTIFVLLIIKIIYYSENAEILEALYEMTKTIIEITGDCIIIYVRKLFSILLTI